MDWDECIENSSAQTPSSIFNSGASQQSGVSIVLDTNVLIDNLPVIQSLMNDALFDQHGRRPHLVVPYVVLQELDYQKQRKVIPVSTQAQNAIRYIHERLKAKDIRFHG